LPEARRQAAPVGLVLVLATLVLAGFTGVVSSNPWFTATDAAGAPRLARPVRTARLAAKSTETDYTSDVVVAHWVRDADR
jgi:hypothetical protein